MKKTIRIVLITLLTIAGLLFLTGCTNNSSKGVDLTLDFTHMNNTTYSIHINTNDTVSEFDEEEPNFVRLENIENNYVLDITLDTEAKEAYDGFQTSAKESEEYNEVSFGKYNGYYADDNGDIYGYILLDESDETFNVFANFVLYLNDETIEDSDINNIYKLEQIQNSLNTIEFKASK